MSCGFTALMAGIVLLSFAAGCRKAGGEGCVAKVGSTSLTRDEINRIRASRPDSAIDLHAYVNEWVTTELLYQEAQRRGIAGSEEVRRQLQDAQRRLAVAAFLQHEVYDDTSGVTEDAITACFAQNRAGFVLQDDLVNISYVLFSTKEAANDFHSRVASGNGWTEEVARLREDSTKHGVILQTADRQYFTRGRLFPPELWKLAVTLPRNGVSFVMKAENGFYVLLSHSVQHRGDVAELGFVRNEVRDRLLMDLRRERYEKLLADLRARANVEIGPEAAAPATTE